MNYINPVSNNFAMQELTDDEVLSISGGHPLIAAAAIGGAAGALWAAGGAVGKSLGKAMYHLLN